MKTGEIEVVADSVKVLNQCNASMPFQIHKFHEVALLLFADVTAWSSK